jgi:hypothetical protein
MRYLTRDMQMKMQFFGIAFEGIDLHSLIEEECNSEYPLDVYGIYYNDIEENKQNMRRLLPNDLKNKIFNSDGSTKKDALNDELYRDLVAYKKEFSNEWEKLCLTVVEEEKKIRKTLPKSIKKLIKLYMHDESVTSIYFEDNNKLVVELDERIWGKPILIFKGVEKAEILTELYPACWIYDELFGLENGKYEFNVLFNQGEISIIFTDFEIHTKIKKYLSKIIEEFSSEAINIKLDEVVKLSIERDGNHPNDETISFLTNVLLSDIGFFQKVSECIGYKERFAGRTSLNKVEKEISLLNEFISNLIYDSVSAKSGFRNGGFHNIETFTKSNIDNIIRLLSKIGPKYLYRITMEAKNIFEETCEEEKTQKIKRLNAKIKRRYSNSLGNTDEIFTSFTNYIKANKDNF